MHVKAKRIQRVKANPKQKSNAGDIEIANFRFLFRDMVFATKQTHRPVS